MAMDWTKSGRRDAFEYIRVSFPDFQEVDELKGITSCSIEKSAFTTLKVSGKIDFDEIPEWAHNLKDDLIRIYSISRLDDHVEKICHATLFATNSTGTFSGRRKSGDYKLYSVLKVLQDEQLTEPLSIPKGINVVEAVSTLVEERGLKTSVSPSEATTKTDITFEFGTELIKVANSLLTAVGYRSLYVDAYGCVCISPIQSLEAQTPACTLSDTDPTLSISASSFDTDFDTSSIPNYVVCISEDEDGNSHRAIATNIDIHSPWSIPNRKRKITRCEKFDKGISQAKLQEKAEELLKSSMMKVEKITIEHLFQPFETLDAINFQYIKSAKTGKYSVSNQSLEMKPGIPCKTTMRRFIQLAEMSTNE